VSCKHKKSPEWCDNWHVFARFVQRLKPSHLVLAGWFFTVMIGFDRLGSSGRKFLEGIEGDWFPFDLVGSRRRRNRLYSTVRGAWRTMCVGLDLGFPSHGRSWRFLFIRLRFGFRVGQSIKWLWQVPGIKPFDWSDWVSRLISYVLEIVNPNVFRMNKVSRESNHVGTNSRATGTPSPRSNDIQWAG